MAEISIIVPSLNVLPYIRECLDSLRGQTFKDIEIICVDAGSDDGTVDLIKQIADCDHRVKLVHSERRSYGYQVNLGIKLTKGEYIGIVDSDDFVEKDMYEVLYGILHSSGYDYIKCNYWIDRQLKTGVIERQGKLNSLISDSDMSNLLEKPVSICQNPEILLGETYIWNGLYRKDFLLQNNIWVNETKGAAWQDIGFSVQMMLRAKKIYYTNRRFNHYRMGRPGNSSENPNMLNYLYQEWKDISDQISLNNATVRRCLFSRLAWHFTNVYTEALRTVDYDITSEYLTRYAWFKQILETALPDNDYSLIGDSVYERLGLILSDPKAYADIQQKLDQRKRQLQEKNIRKIANDGIVIFGCGEYGKNVLEALDSTDMTVSAMTDNNSSLWGRTIGGFPVISPNDCVSHFRDGNFIVANKYHAEEIKEQLIKTGISGRQIVIWQ